MEHYEWRAHTCSTGGWFVNGDNRIFTVHAPTLREALDDALTAQFKWSTRKDEADAKPTV
jgi:hypothetical protein